MDDRPKILSIDDNDSNQKLIEKALGSNYDVEVAMSGSTGIEVLTKFKPDAILLDVDMPYLDGIRLCRMIRAEPSFDSTPILFVSALGSHHDQVRGYQAGGDDYITKPLNLEQLKDKLDHSLRRAKNKRDHIRASNDAPALERSIQLVLDGVIELIALQDSVSVGRHVLSTLDGLGLKGAVYVHQTQQTYSSIGPLSDLETLLLQQAKHPYPSEFSARYLWGSETIGAIIQNMPHAQYEKYQPVVQLISSLLNGADQKLQILQHQFKTNNGKSKSSHGDDAKGESAERKYSLQIHRFKLENALEELEHQSERQLSQLCHQLKKLAQSPHRDMIESRQLFKLAEMGLQARLTIYDQCLEVQSHYNAINQITDKNEVPA